MVVIEMTEDPQQLPDSVPSTEESSVDALQQRPVSVHFTEVPEIVHSNEDSTPDPAQQLIVHSIGQSAERTFVKTVFDELDQDGDGYLNFTEIKQALSRRNYNKLADGMLINILRVYDTNTDNRLDFEEFYKLSQRDHNIFTTFLENFLKKVVPLPHRVEADDTDGSYEQSMKICPPPLTMIIFSIIQILVFLIDIAIKSHENENEHWASPTQIFLYTPKLRSQVWRFVTYMFLHKDCMHLMINLIAQIFLGVALELVHCWWRVALIYMAGVVAGSMGFSILNPTIALDGASGGVYALLTAHIATIILNWSEMEFACEQLFVLLVFCVCDAAFSTNDYLSKTRTDISFVAHLAGGVAGLLVGICVLRNVKVRFWQLKLWWFSVTIYFSLMITGICIHLFDPNHFFIADE